MKKEKYNNDLGFYSRISNIKEYVSEQIENGVPYYFYKKFSKINAEQGTLGQIVKTKKGKEIVNKDSNGNLDWIVTNPNGEKFIVPHKTFASRYETKVGPDGKHAPISNVIKAIQIFQDISFTASWGSEMKIKAGGFLDITNLNDIYGIQEKDFNETYAECNKSGIFFDPKLKELFSQDDENSI